MAQFMVRNLEESVKIQLQERAMHHGCSMEEEVRAILRQAVCTPINQTPKLGTALRNRFEHHGFENDIPEQRGHSITPARFDE